MTYPPFGSGVDIYTPAGLSLRYHFVSVIMWISLIVGMGKKYDTRDRSNLEQIINFHEALDQLIDANLETSR